MKRSPISRDSPPLVRAKRRGSVGRYNDGSSDERLSPERMRRRIARSPSPRYGSPPRDKYAPIAHTFKVLCVSALHSKASDEYIKETLYRDFKKFGDFNIRLSYDSEQERIAYVCFRTSEDAKAAKASRPRVLIYDKAAIVEPVYEAVRARPRSVSPGEYDRHYYSRSPGHHSRPPPPEHHYEGYGPPRAVHHPPGFRPVIHSEYGMPPRHHPPMHTPMHYVPRPYMPRPRVPYEKAENKKDKFPNYLQHVAPEDDPLATRTLFAGNLEINISDDEMKRIFGKYGIVEDIDIKRPPPGTGNAFAFVRYQTLDMAHRAKVELSGQYIGKFQCKIGYGKAIPTVRIWIGGLGPWTSSVQLEGEFDRFGAIKKIEYTKGDTQAFIVYESIDAATAAVKAMRGYKLGGPDKRLRIDFADSGEPTPTPFKPKPPYESSEYRKVPEYEGAPSYDEGYHGHAPHYVSSYAPRPYRGRGGYRGRGAYRGGYHAPDHRMGHPEEDWRRSGPMNDMEYGDPYRSRRSPPTSRPGVDRSRSRSPKRHSLDSDSEGGSKRNGTLGLLRSLTEVAKKSSTKWEGSLILKSSLFPAKLHITDGDTDIVESLMLDENGSRNLRITQRLRLDQPKLEDVQKRISSSSSHAIFLGLAGSTSSIPSDDANVQTRPLRNLVSYLKQKEAAGVISLLNKETEATGVLYVFPPCDFSTELLKRTCISLTEESLKEDHLVIVVVRGGTA